jgi:hypothetical protein
MQIEQPPTEMLDDILVQLGRRYRIQQARLPASTRSPGEEVLVVRTTPGGPNWEQAMWSPEEPTVGVTGLLNRCLVPVLTEPQGTDIQMLGGAVHLTSLGVETVAILSAEEPQGKAPQVLRLSDTAWQAWLQPEFRTSDVFRDRTLATWVVIAASAQRIA